MSTPKSPNEPQASTSDPSSVDAPGALHSINEPPGSDVNPKPEQHDKRQAEQHDKPRAPLPSHDELERMKRDELNDLAHSRGVDISGASNKEDVIEALQKDARKRR